MAHVSGCMPLDRTSVVEAHKIISQHVHCTPVVTNATLSRLASTRRSSSEIKGSRWEGRAPAQPTLRLWFKCENMQRVGAFKVRGAFHAIERLKQEPGWLENGGMKKGVATHSSGNHAQALALAARESGMPAHIVMPTISAPNKIMGARGYGAKVVFSGNTTAEREATANEVVSGTGARLVPPYDHPDIILGQGTLGLEFQEQVSRLTQLRHSSENPAFHPVEPPSTSAATGKGLDAIITPCGGGGMLSGVALSCEGTGIRVFGSEPEFEGADDCKRGFLTGQRVETVQTLTIADGLRTPVGKYPWSIIYERRLVQSIYSASEEEIKAAMRLVFERLKLVIEPSAAVPLAIVLYNEDFRSLVEKEAGADGWDLGLVFSGGNVSMERVAELFSA